MAATTLAGFPPVELIAEERRILYWRIKELREEWGLRARDERALKSQAVARTHEMWADILSDPRGYGLQTAEAVRPCLPELAGRRGCGLSFHLVQILTGHGCFGKYLHQIGKELTTRCHHSSVLMDTALHTLAACPAWEEERRILAGAIGWRDGEISFPRMVAFMCGSEEDWKAAASFCKDIMSRKEAAERERRPRTTQQGAVKDGGGLDKRALEPEG
ncbi:uncharacterized protein LOC112590167 [Harpegnathos saltator]|uniref:uncharacterized protein LOC112590167 n=1 Tax=Harpegnathos saltator TaxID=610380 RepID=UPI000DBED055|nr:uncharacterized protein LOC112590167 [Harpegnathos saltator]